MAKRKIDLAVDGASISTNIVIEPAVGSDSGAWSPARALQVNGLLLSNDNPLPVVLPGTITLASGTAIQVSSLPSITGTVSLSNDTTISVSNNFALDTSVIAIRDRLPSVLLNNRLPVDGSAVTQPISASTLPLPTDASTSSLQSTGNTLLTDIKTKLDTLVVSANQNGVWSVTVQDVSTSTLQTAGNNSLSSIDTKLSTLSGISTKLDTLPLPTGAATNTTLTEIRDRLQPTALNVSRSLLQYYTSVEGGCVAFNATASNTAIPTSTNGVVVCVFYNPSNSGVDLYLARLVLNAAQAGTFKRYRGTGVTNIAATPTPATALNRGGSTNVPKGKVYGHNQVTPTNPIFGKTSRVTASVDNNDDINGSIILRPGQYISWTYAPNNNASDCDIEVVWWELTAKT